MEPNVTIAELVKSISNHQVNIGVNNGYLCTKEFNKYGSSLLGTEKLVIDVETPPSLPEIPVFVRGVTDYLLNDHRGNNMAMVTDKKLQHSTDGATIDYYLADVRTASYYSAYGAISKSFNDGEIDLAHNGQKRSTEISASAQTALFWEYDGDVGRRWNVDPATKVSESPYFCFSGNPITSIDILGDSASNPGGPPSPNVGEKYQFPHLNKKGEMIARTPGKNKTVFKMPGNATDWTIYDNTSNYQVDGKSVNVGAGDVRSITTDGNIYSARWNSDLSFAGYYNSEGKMLKLDTGPTNLDVVLKVGQFLWSEASPIQGVDAYTSAQIKDNQKMPFATKYIEKTEITWTLAGIQGGYNTNNAGGWYATAGTLNNSYIQATQGSQQTRLSPIAGSWWAWGNSQNAGDFNLQGRTLLTVIDRKAAQVQVDMVYNQSQLSLGMRIKSEIPTGLGNTKGEFALGLRYRLVWPKMIQRALPGFFRNK
jgi:hypothetical protein